MSDSDLVKVRLIRQVDYFLNKEMDYCDTVVFTLNKRYIVSIEPVGEIDAKWAKGNFYEITYQSGSGNYSIYYVKSAWLSLEAIEIIPTDKRKAPLGNHTFPRSNNIDKVPPTVEYRNERVKDSVVRHRVRWLFLAAAVVVVTSGVLLLR